MPGSLHQRILALICQCPEIAITLWKLAEPTATRLHAERWVAHVADINLRVRNFDGTEDSHRLADCVITLHSADTPNAPPKIVLVIECQLKPAKPKIYTWSEYLAAARRLHQAIGRTLVMSPVDTVIVWANGVFDDEPKQRPELLGRDHLPRITDLDEAILTPELAVLSAVFHGPHEGGAHIARTAAQALRTLPELQRKDYYMLLEDALPEEMMPEIRKITFEEAEAAADEWMRNRGPYKIGHREGREEGLLRGRHEALALVLELRGLVPTEAEQSRIDACDDQTLIERWCQRAKTAASVAELFA